MYIQFTLRTIECDWTKDGKSVQFKFSFMDTVENDKLLVKLQANSGEYSVAEKISTLVFINC